MSKAPPPSAPVSPSTIPAAPPSSGPYYGFTTPYPSEPFQNQPPPTYAQAVGGVPPAAPFTPQQPSLVQQHIITTIVRLGLEPTHMICPRCQKEIQTKVQRSPKVGAYLAGLLCCLVGLVCGCCLIPCCINECMTVHHICPNCNNFIGSSSKSF